MGQGVSATQLQQHPTASPTHLGSFRSPTTSRVLLLLPCGRNNPQPDSQGLCTLMPSASRLRSMFCNKKILKTKGVLACSHRVEGPPSPGADVPTHHLGGQWGTHHCSPRVSACSRVARSPLGLQRKRE